MCGIGLRTVTEGSQNKKLYLLFLDTGLSKVPGFYKNSNPMILLKE
jgi:hypothetical protein